MLFSVIASVSATCNVLVITDPTGEDPNGAAAGSMSFAQNMFQSSFILSKNTNEINIQGEEYDEFFWVLKSNLNLLN